MGIDPLVYRSNDTVQIRFHFMIFKAQKPDSDCFQFSLPGFIFRPLEFVAVAVDFHREHQLVREEIHDLAVDGLLAVEVESTTLAAFQLLPEQHFGEGALVAQVSGEFLQHGIIGEFHDSVDLQLNGGAKTHPALLAPLLIEGIQGVGMGA
jgi:hypothetical protein